MPQDPLSPDATPSQVPSRHEGSPCPNCAAPNVHRSHRRGLTEHLLAVVGAHIRRCHSCNVRFARVFSSAVYIDDARRLLRRIALFVLMLLGAALVIATMLWLMRKQAAIGPSDGRLAPPPPHCAAGATFQFRTASPATPPAATKFTAAALRPELGDRRITHASDPSIPPVMIVFSNSARPVLNVPFCPRSSGLVSAPPRDDATSSTLAATTTATDAHHRRFDLFSPSAARPGAKCPSIKTASRHTTTFVLLRRMFPSPLEL